MYPNPQSSTLLDRTLLSQPPLEIWGAKFVRRPSARSVIAVIVLSVLSVSFLTLRFSPDQHSRTFTSYLLRQPRYDALSRRAAAPLPIYQLQGDGLETPYVQQWVDTYGVVTGVVREGFYLQDPVGDGNPATSDGIYVYTRTPPTVIPGQCVLLQRAYVDEFYAKTELSRLKAILPSNRCATATVVPVAIPVATLRQDSAAQFERYEGMVVELAGVEGIVQGPTKHFADGEMEFAMLAKEYLPYLAGGRLFQTDRHAMNALLYLSNTLGAELPEVRWGDTLILGDSQRREPTVRAILDFNFGKYQLLLWPDTVMTTRRFTTALPPLDVALPATADDITICTYNLHGMGRGSEQYWEPQEYDRQLAKRARTIAESLAGCLIIGMQEAGKPEDVEHLTTLLQSAYGLDYAPLALPGPNTTSNEFPLTNSLIARRDRVQIVAAEARQGCSAEDYAVTRLANDCPPGTFPLFNRPPLLVDMMVQGAWHGPFPLTVVVNHWKSKGGDESVNVVRRTAQAAHVATLVQERLALDPATQLVVLGDLNDYYASGPLATLREGTQPPLLHTYDQLPAQDRYSYVFNGGSQILDHLLVTPNLAPLIARVDPVHVNADYPAGDNAQVALLQQSSDHDPVLLQLRPTGVGVLGGNLGFPNIRLVLRQWAGDEASVSGEFVVGESDSCVDAGAESDFPEVASTMTDASGDFRFWALTPGQYYLCIDAPAHFSQSTQPGILSIEPGYQTLFVQPMPVNDSRNSDGEEIYFIHQDITDATAVMRLAPQLLDHVAGDDSQGILTEYTE